MYLLFHVLVVRAGRIDGTDEVDLVILELEIVAVDVDDVVGVVDAEYRVRRVPVYRVELGAGHRHRRQHQLVQAADQQQQRKARAVARQPTHGSLARAWQGRGVSTFSLSLSRARVETALVALSFVISFHCIWKSGGSIFIKSEVTFD